MKAWLFIFLSAVVLVGCGQQDLIDRLPPEAAPENERHYEFQLINLPPTAAPEEIIATLSQQTFWKIDFKSCRVLKVWPVQTQPPESQMFEAVRLDTNLGQEIVLLRPKLTEENKWVGWEYHVYDVK